MARNFFVKLVLASSMALFVQAYAVDKAQSNDPAMTDANLPTRGMSMDRVRKQWGEPAQTVAAVGDPPISRWKFDDFTVYFEHKLVITSVSAGDIAPQLIEKSSQ